MREAGDKNCPSLVDTPSEWCSCQPKRKAVGNAEKSFEEMCGKKANRYWVGARATDNSRLVHRRASEPIIRQFFIGEARQF